MDQYKSAMDFVALTANGVLGALFFGYSISYLNPATNYYPNYFRITDYEQNTQTILKALVGSFLTLAAGAGAVSSGSLLSHFSIRKSFMITDLIGLIGVIIELIPNIYIFLLARILIGFSVGLNSSLVPQYIKEFSPKELSGPLGAANQLTINIGQTTGLITAFFYQVNNNNYNTLRICFEIPGLFCIIRTILLIFIFKNEPPSYYIQNNRIEQATKVLEQYYYPDSVQAVLNKIIQNQEKINSQKQTYSDLFKLPTQRKKLFVGCGLQVLQQFSGINAILFFSGIIFGQILNNEQQKINWANALVGIICTTFSIIAIQLLKNYGRRPLMLYGTSVCSIFLLISFIFSFYTDPLLYQQILSIASIFGYLGAFQLSMGPISWIYDADILSEKGMSLAVLSNWICCSIIAFSFTILDIEQNQQRLPIVFGFFTTCCILGIFFVFKYVQETKDRTQSTIDNIFSLQNINKQLL